MTLYPWQEEQWAQLQAARDANRLHHALLLTGPRGTGKATFARLLAQSLLCHSPLPGRVPCGTCRDCTLFTAGTHPDCFMVQPEDGGSAIKIDQIRELSSQLSLTSGSAKGTRVALIDPADAMNRNAANSLLKTLEEPAPGTVMLLTAHNPGMLPPTVRSRCQCVSLSGDHRATMAWLRPRLQPDTDPAVALALANGGPLLAVAMDGEGMLAERDRMLAELQGMASGSIDAVSVGSRWAGLKSGTAEGVLAALLRDLLRLKVPGAAASVCQGDLVQGLQATAEKVDWRKIACAQDLLHHHSQLIASGTNVRAQDLLEEFAIHWAE